MSLLIPKCASVTLGRSEPFDLSESESYTLPPPLSDGVRLPVLL